ncbi:MAG: hypothetical protein LC775_08055, partial [Acidobacteria bacterium]|nr:hypothetical protein [Acidobacteriota bacterium]
MSKQHKTPRAKATRGIFRRLHRRTFPTRGGRYAPRLWHVSIAVITAVITAGFAAWLTYVGLQTIIGPVTPSSSAPTGTDAPPNYSKLDLIKTTIAGMAFWGAVLAGVYAYRKQRLAEGDAHRLDSKQFIDRYGAAAEQLGSDAAAVRLAGAYAMARLADDWEDQRQMCVDVLCAYIRMPYETDATKPNFREGDREVRRTIIRIIRNSLRRETLNRRWRNLVFSFEGATFDCGDLSGAIFDGGYVNFRGTRFIDGVFHFSGAVFRGTGVAFSRSVFGGTEVIFDAVDFSGARHVRFDDAEFSSGVIK